MVIWKDAGAVGAVKMYHLFPHLLKEHKAYYVAYGARRVSCFTLLDFGDEYVHVPKKKLKDILW